MYSSNGHEYANYDEFLKIGKHAINDTHTVQVRIMYVA